MCNLGSIILDSHLSPDGSLDHKKLRESDADGRARSGQRHRHQLLPSPRPPNAPTSDTGRSASISWAWQNALYHQGSIAFASPEAVEFNDEVMEAVAFYAYEASSDLAAERGTYSSYKGSKWDRGLLPQDTVVPSSSRSAA